MINGLLVDDDDHMTMFPHLEKEYWIKDVFMIEVV